MSALLEHARTEMRAAGWYDADADYGGAVATAVEEIVQVFDRQGHSGMSAALVIGITQKLLQYEPLAPLTGADDEWCEVVDGELWQNKRCSRVFKGADGAAYDSEGRVFVEPDGMAYTNHKSRVPVTFPYTPTTEYVKMYNAPEPTP